MHVILQTGSQVHAHRLQLYASSPHLQAFSNAGDFCSTAEELGSRESDHKGPCLVLLTNCRIAPEDLNLHIRSTFLRGYVVRVYWYEHTSSSRGDFIAHVKTLIAKQMWSGKQFSSPQIISGRNEGVRPNDDETDKPREETKCAQIKLNLQQTDILKKWLCTADQCLPVAFHDSANLIEVENKESKLKVRLQTHPRDLADFLVDELTEIDCQLHGFTCSLYAVHVDGSYRYGIGSGDHMYLAPCNREDLAKGYISRASLKLEETMQVLGFHLHHDMIAMDLGASPGAWTQYLSKHIKQVVAVDPAPLQKQVLQPNVLHIKKMAQDATKELLEYNKGKGFDLLVCDINRHPVEAAQVVAPLLVHLCKGGLLVLTLKFHGRGRNKEMKAEEMKHFFQGLLTDMDCIWLLANSAYERTFVGKKL